ncbi:XRE family transcriptional regulator (plasmid) [Alcanivorax sp. N3-2A]|nr:XRE family transcriptional regulator [Alcanivorax sp. N3-2A]ASK36642.1 XRE family transcriptional regulator [Alcanivorax sp. N3-2A]|tara:strand:- start:61581 stop:62501 length:921 start_codon:yes stop_codon:yes gene_type:complete
MNEQEAALPGARLRQAREEKGLSRQDVARELHLSTAFLTFLEEDDYDRLPEPPFVKGYLRNYARLLGLSGEELATLYQRRLDEDRRHTREQEAVAEPRPRGREWRLPALVVLLAVLVIAVGWWLWPREQPQQDSDTAPADANPELRMEQDPAGEPPERAPEPALPDTVEPAGPDTGSEDADAAQGEDPQAPGDATAAAGPVASNGASAAAPAAAADTGADAAPAAPEVDRLSMTFSRVCWIRIIDASGATLSQGRRNAGDRVSVEGKAPFRMTIGDAAAVSSLTINDEPTELPSSRSGDVVRVTLP